MVWPGLLAERAEAGRPPGLAHRAAPAPPAGGCLRRQLSPGAAQEGGWGVTFCTCHTSYRARQPAGSRLLSPRASLTDMGATPQETHRHGGGAGECGWEGDHRAALPSAGGYGGTAPTWQCRERSPSLRKQGEVVFVGGRDRETRGLSAGPPRAGRLAGPLGLGRKPPREGGSTRGSGAARMKVAGSPGTGGRPA